MRILVTGASGLVGCQVLRALVEQSDTEILAVSRSSNSELAGVKWILGDLLDAEFRGSLFTSLQFDVVIHLAWETTHGEFWHSPRNMDWVAGSMDLLERFIQGGGRRFIGIGTGFEYAPPDDGPCIPNETDLKSETLYSVSKDAFRRIASARCQHVGIEFVWARLFSLISQQDSAQRLIPAVIRGCARGEQIPCSYGRQVRDFLDVRVCGDALAHLADSPLTGELNVSSGNPVTLQQIVRTIADLMNGPHLPQFGALPERDGEPPNLWGAPFWNTHHDSFQPTIDTREALRWAIEYWGNVDCKENK